MNLLIHGTGTQAKLIYAEICRDKKYNVAGFTCDDEFFKDENFIGKKVFKTDILNSEVTCCVFQLFFQWDNVFSLA